MLSICFPWEIRKYQQSVIKKNPPYLELQMYVVMAIHSIIEALPGVLGNRGIRPFISGEQGNKRLKLKGTGEQGQFWGTRNLENQDKMPIFFSGEQGNRYPPPSRPWEGHIIQFAPSCQNPESASEFHVFADVWLEVYGLVNTVKVLSSRSVNQLTLFVGKLSPSKWLTRSWPHAFASIW